MPAIGDARVAEQDRLREFHEVGGRRDLHHDLEPSRHALKGRRGPESRFIATKIGMDSSPNCGIDLARVARKIPSDVSANR